METRDKVIISSRNRGPAGTGLNLELSEITIMLIHHVTAIHVLDSLLPRAHVHVSL